MCIGGRPAYAVPQRQEAAFQDAPPVVTGSQTGVDKPKDTKKATEELKIRRQKKEGTYIDPNLSRTEELVTGRSGGGNKTAQQKALEGLAKNVSSQLKRKFPEIYALHNPKAAPLVNFSSSQISDSLGITQSYAVSKKSVKTQPVESQSVSNSEIATEVFNILKSHNLTMDRIVKFLK